jgi:hypothetical protein
MKRSTGLFCRVHREQNKLTFAREAETIPDETGLYYIFIVVASAHHRKKSTGKPCR